MNLVAKQGVEAGNPLLARDLQTILESTAGLWEPLRGQQIFITGGTGFFGRWLLESFACANENLGLGARVVVLSRNPAAFQTTAPHLAANPALRFWAGDVRDFEFPEGSFAYAIHAATDASAKLNAEEPLTMFDTIVEGTRRVLEFARERGVARLLLTSSGAVYGPQPTTVSHVTEDYAGAPAPLDPRSAYGEGKRAAEMLCALYGRQHNVVCTIARCFAFAGPFLPLGTHFAIGNFVRDALAGRPIQIQGDGTPLRSYLYAADLAAWLWTILFRGEPARAYNVGSERSVSIRQTAEAVAAQFCPRPQIQIAGIPRPGAPPQPYVPSTQRARAELGLKETVPLEESIRRMVAWHQHVPEAARR